jgi:outer membrane beta-barrel protein
VSRFQRLALIAVVLSAAVVVRAEEAESEAEVLEVEKVKEKYWAQGEESQLGVVQNRAYSKAGKLQLGLLGGKAIDDPFLSNTVYGFDVGYNFNEFWGLSVLGLNYKVSPSSALEQMRKPPSSKNANTVATYSYLGAEGTASFLYGKLSLMGARIVYYDMHLTFGGGLTNTENDKLGMTGSVGIGQRFYITQPLSLRFDYRMQTFKATVKEKEISTRLGEEIGQVRHFNHLLSAELVYMFDVTGGTK